jgi:hypothetical protein
MKDPWRALNLSGLLVMAFLLRKRSLKRGRSLIVAKNNINLTP